MLKRGFTLWLRLFKAAPQVQLELSNPFRPQLWQLKLFHFYLTWFSLTRFGPHCHALGRISA